MLEYADGHQLSQTTYSYLEDSYAQTLEVTAVRGGLQTVTVLDFAHGDRTLSVRHPDGRLDVYTYENGTFDGSTTNPIFTAGSGSYSRASISHGIGTDPGNPTFVAGKSTIETVVRNAAGRPVLEETYAWIDAAFVRVQWTMRELDARGRELNVYRSHGTRAEIVYSDTQCCGTRTVTDDTGTVTDYVLDALGRITSQIKHGAPGAPPPLDADITTTTSYYHEVDQASGDVVRVVKTEIPGSGLTPTYMRYDLAGRPINETDSAGLVTRHAYSATGSPLQVTGTEPGGATRITQHLRDGRIASLSGTAVVGRYNQYTVEGANSYSVKVATDGSANSPRYVKTFYDGLGRPTSEERPASGSGTLVTQNIYDATTGRLKSVLTPGQAATLYVYDELSNL